MEINYFLDKNNNIIGWSNVPFDPTLPFIEIENPEEIILGYTKVIDGKLVIDKEKYDNDNLVNDIRIRRERECFSIVNRGLVWYNLLTKAQKNELQQWYEAWLEAPQTLVIPEKPSWL